MSRPDLFQDFDTGPWPAAEVPDPPDLLLELLRHRGVRLTAAQVLEYERVRAYLAFPGVALTPALQAVQNIRPVKASPVRRSRATTAARPDSADLGDD